MMMIFWTKLCHDLPYAFLAALYWLPMSTTYDWFHSATDGMFYAFVPSFNMMPGQIKRGGASRFQTLFAVKCLKYLLLL